MMKETKRIMADTGIRVLDIEVVRMDPATEPETYESFLEAGGELDARSVICHLPDPERNRATERFARLCDLAEPFGLNVDIEFMPWMETPDLNSALRNRWDRRTILVRERGKAGWQKRRV